MILAESNATVPADSARVVSVVFRTGTWRPDAAPVVAVDSAVVAAVSAAHATLPHPLRFLASSFDRQYGGVIIAGRRLLNVNGAAPDLRMRLRRRPAFARDSLSRAHVLSQPVIPADGGELSWGVLVDLRSHGRTRRAGIAPDLAPLARSCPCPVFSAHVHA